MIDKGFLIRLTDNLYKLTLLFPKKEPLRYKLRELADDVLANSIRILNRKNLSKPIDNEYQVILEDLEVIDGFFAITKEQNWVDQNRLFTIQEEYGKIKKYLSKNALAGTLQGFTPKIEEQKPVLQIQNQNKKELTKLKQREILGSSFEINRQEKILLGTQDKELKDNKIFNARHQKILEILKEKGVMQIWEIKKVFPEVTKRTLRRDFRQLIDKGLIERMGERNNTFYQIKSVGQSIQTI